MQKDHDDNFDYIVTPFPEAISNGLCIPNPYIIWGALSLVLLVARVGAMILCGEEAGRFAINIVYTQLPGLFAMLIIFYSKKTERSTRIIRKIVVGHSEEEITKAYSRLIRQSFRNSGMIIAGMLFLGLFGLILKSQPLYPTPTHNILHRAKVRDRILVNVVKSWIKENNESGGITKETTGGWVQLPLGKVIRLANEENQKLYEVLTRTPQETYDTHPPESTHDENLNDPEIQYPLVIDPEWQKATKAPSKKPTHAELKKIRAATLPTPLRQIYLNHNPGELWRFSQITYMAVMLPMLFMSGAMLWCLGGITWISWQLGRKRRKKPSIWQDINVEIFPHPSRSICAVGKNLWRAATISGFIYSVIMVCLFFSRPNTMAQAIASLFSLVVVALFVLPQLNLHNLMVSAKYDKINRLDEKLNQALEETTKDANTVNVQQAQSILELQKTLAETREWPCDIRSLAMVVSSVIIPIVMALFTLYEHFK